MIDQNTIKFGYGDISVGHDAFAQKIKFQQFKPPAKCGMHVPEDVEFIGDKIIIEISYQEYCDLSKKLNEVFNRNIYTFCFKGYIFDFTNYNVESVRVCTEHLQRAMSIYLLCMAA